MNPIPIEKELLDNKGKPIAWLVENQLCSKCRNNAIYYYEQFDAHFCAIATSGQKEPVQILDANIAVFAPKSHNHFL